MLFTLVLILTAVSAAGVTWLLHGFSSWMFVWELPLFLLLFYAVYVALTLVTVYCYCRIRENLDEPSREDRKIRWLLYKVVDFIFSVLRTRFHVTGLERVPEQGRVMVVCNHISILDPLSLHHVLPKTQMAFISKQENNKLPMVNRLMHGTNCQMLNRENDREALTVILKCIELLKNDEVSIGVFPEGYTSLNGHLQPYRNGVFKIAQRAKVPIVVCTIKGTSEVFQNFIHLKRSHVYLDILGVVPVEELAGTTKDLGDRIHVLMENNLGEMGKPLLEGARRD